MPKRGGESAEKAARLDGRRWHSLARTRRLRRGGAGAAGRLLGRRAAGDPSAEQFQRLERRRRRKRPHPGRLGRRCSRQGRRLRLARRRRQVEAPPTPGSTSCRSSPARRNGPCRGPGPGARRSERPRTCRSSGAARTGWIAFVTAAVARYGPERQLLGRAPERAETPDPRLADLERAELQVLRRQAQPGRIREARQALLHGAESGRPGGAGRPRRPLLAAERGDCRNGKPPQAYFASDFLERMYETTPGIKSKFNGVALHPYTSDLPGADPGDRRIPQRPDAEPRRRQGPLDHRARLELRAAEPRGNPSPRAPPARRPS